MSSIPAAISPAAETRRALRDFADRARDADIAVVYYAGHGIEVDGANYLIPVDARLERDTDVYDEGSLARPRPDRDRAGQEAAARDPRRLPRQSVFQDHEADGGFAGDRAGSRQGRADQPERPDRLFGQGRLHGRRRRRQEQPVHGSAVAPPDEARARRAPGLRLCPRRGAQDHGQQAGTLCVRFARR